MSGMDLRGKAALITGGARIGQDVAEALAARGCDVALTYRRSKERAQDGARRVLARGARCELVAADLSLTENLDRVVPLVEKAFGRLDVLVHMASIYQEAPLEELSKTASGGGLAGARPWQEALDVEAKAAYWLALRAAPVMRRAGEGRIVAVSDWLPASGRPRYKGWLPYYVAKAAVKALTEQLALELAPQILVNAVAPGPTVPPEDMPERDRREAAEQTPLKRWGGGEEIAKAVLFFCETGFVTGECLRVDGGRHLY